MKIGGSSLRNISGFRQMMKILSKENSEPIVMVVSAFSTATRKLKEAALKAESSSYEEACSIIDSIIYEHYNYCDVLLDNEENKRQLRELYDRSSNRIKQFLKGISITEDLTARTLDILLSFGEMFALRTIRAYLAEQGFDVTDIDSTRLICSDDYHGKAKPLIDESTEKINSELLPLLKDKKIILTQGFVASSRSGEITTMGMESSNLTAVIIASVLGCKQLTFWTNVEGVRTADPDLAFQTKNIPLLSYDFAYQIAKSGLKLIYPSMIDIAKRSNIELIYRSCFNPEGKYTVIKKGNTEISEPITIVDNDTMLCNIPIRNSKEELSATQYLQKLMNTESLEPTIFRQSNSIKILFHSANKRYAIFPQGQTYKKIDGLSLITYYSKTLDFSKSINDIAKLSYTFTFSKDDDISTIRILADKDNLKDIISRLNF